MSAFHELKASTEYFQALWDRSKKFECCPHLQVQPGAPFSLGDTVILKEWDPTWTDTDKPDLKVPGHFTGRYVTAKVSFIEKLPDWHLRGHYYVLSLDFEDRGWATKSGAFPYGHAG